MRFHGIRAAAAAVILSGVGGAATANAQSALMADLLSDVTQVEQKLISLANAMPADTYDWRPGEGVRSVAEVFQHVTANNYLLAAPYLDLPAWTNIDPSNYDTVLAFESRELDREQIIDELTRSFAHVKRAMETTTDARLGESVELFGRPWSVRTLWLLTVTHMHEHLGQSIAYARTNGVVPPWSR